MPSFRTKNAVPSKRLSSGTHYICGIEKSQTFRCFEHFFCLFRALLKHICYYLYTKYALLTILMIDISINP